MTDFNKFLGVSHGDSGSVDRHRGGFISSMAVHALALVILGAARNYPSAPPVAIRDSFTLLSLPPRRIIQTPAHHRNLRPVKVWPTVESSLSPPSRTILMAIARPAPTVSLEPEVASPPTMLASVPLVTPSFLPVPSFSAQTKQPVAETGQFVSHHPQVASPARLPAVQNAGFDSSRSPVASSIPEFPAAQHKGYKFNDVEQNIPASIQNRGIVRSGAFSSSDSGPGPFAATRAVVESGFGSTASAKPRPAQTAIPPAVPEGIRILDWRRPSYTAEARDRQIEGDVLLETVFTSDGEVRILRVVHGLGYGLDENAVVAARAIRFTPARKDGRTVDLHGNIRLTFRLAY